MVRPVTRSWLPFAFAVIAAACNTADLTPSSVVPTSSGGPGPAGGEGDSGVPPIDGGRDPGSNAPLAMSSGVTIQVQPSDSGAALLAAIRGATKSVHMTMYLLTNDDVIDALGDLKQAGKEVKVVLNQNFPTSGNENEAAFTALKNRGVQVQWAPPGYAFTHAKTILIDSEKALIMTMNLTYSSAKTNREYIATDTDAQDVADLEKIFQADFTNKAVSVSSKLVISPATANTLHAPRSHIKQLIDSAKTSLDVEAQSLADETVVDAIVLAHQANVDVRVVIDAQTINTPAQTAAIAKLKQYGVPLRGLKTPDMHAKAIVVDEARTFVGSQNMTSTALEYNREVGVLTDAPAEATKVRDVIRGDFDKGSAL
jgi:phosphatidylserine/phosphatidylglycerophosphate/cardiolipin synthase-like enzyme